MSTTAGYAVTGMTCGHCDGAVTGELQNLESVSEVAVELNPSGLSQGHGDQRVSVERGAGRGRARRGRQLSPRHRLRPR